MSIARAPILGSKHFAEALAFGDFVLVGGPTIHCDAIQGISGVITDPTFITLPDGRPQVALKRILTHFYWPAPEVLIEQNPSKLSTGTLTGNGPGGAPDLLPGTATFNQFIILTLDGRPLANRAPLVMSAGNVTLWPPIGADFATNGPTDFYDLARVDDPTAPVVARLDKCTTVLALQFCMPTLPLAAPPDPPEQ